MMSLLIIVFTDLFLICPTSGIFFPLQWVNLSFRTTYFRGTVVNSLLWKSGSVTVMFCQLSNLAMWPVPGEMILEFSELGLR